MATKTPTTSAQGSTQTKPGPDDTAAFQIEFLGTEYADVIYGNDYNNRLYGLAGNDILMGDAGADQLHGNAGIDTANYSNSRSYVSVDLGAAADRGRGYAGDAKGDELFSIENVTGSRYHDIIKGDNQVNVLDGNDGNDTLYGRGGDDTLIGGNGNDILVGGAGADALLGGSGIDTASYHDAGFNMMGGMQVGVFADLQLGGGYGDAFGDSYDGIENLTGSAYSDVLYGDENANVIDGGAGIDHLYGRGGNDTLIGGGGDDVLFGGAGADHLVGGAGRDMADYSDAAWGVNVRLGGVSYNSTAHGDTYDSVEDARGSAHSDYFFGTAADNRFYGEAGNDRFHGDAGADLFDGGSGFDTADYSESLSAVSADLANGGTAGDAAGDSYVSIENLRGSKRDGNVLLGSGADNVISSYGRFDVVDGRGGNDSIVMNTLFSEVSGGAGDDTISILWDPSSESWGNLGVNYHNTANIDGGADTDTVNFSANWIFPASGPVHGGVSVYLEREGSASSGAYYFDGYMYGDAHPDGGHWIHQKTMSGDIRNVENVTGTWHYDDTLFGNEVANALRGLGGDDTLRGWGGDDVLEGGAGSDTLDGGEGSDTAVYTGGSAVQVSLGAGIATHAEYTDTLASIENIVGSGNADLIIGDAGANVLNGGGSGDIIDGAGGNDVLIGGYGADDFVFGHEFYFQESHVTVADFQVGSDQLNLSHLDGIYSYADAMAHFTQVGTDAVLAYEDSTITLENVQVDSLTMQDLLF